MKTIASAIQEFTQYMVKSRSENTARAYHNGLQHFLAVFVEADLDPETVSPEAIRTAHARRFVDYLNAEDAAFSVATRRQYMAALKNFLGFLKARDLAPEVDLGMVAYAATDGLPRAGYRLPKFPKEDLEVVIQYALTLPQAPVAEEKDRLVHLRDAAFILVLADTGLRIHEACKLRKSDLDWQEQRAILIGKGNKEAVIRFSARSLLALDSYLKVRRPLDGASGKPVGSLPVFIGHSPRNFKAVSGAQGKKLPGQAVHKMKPLSTDAGRLIVSQRAREALAETKKDKEALEEAVQAITPHAFRHYFVTTVLLASGGDLKLAPGLARHSDISTTQRYAHLDNERLDKGYYEIFKGKLTTGINLVELGLRFQSGEKSRELEESEQRLLTDHLLRDTI